VLNLLVPIFGATMMVHLHKKLTHGRAAAMALPREKRASLRNS